MKKRNIGIIALIIILIIAGIGCYIFFKNGSNKEDDENYYNGVELTKPVLELSQSSTFLLPTTNFQYEFYISKATVENAPEGFSLIGSPYLTWEEYDFSQPDTMHDVKYELKFPNGESAVAYLHVQTQYDEDDPDNVANSDSSNSSSELPEEGDTGDASGTGREYSSYNLLNGVYAGTGTGEYVLMDKVFKFEDYGDQKSTFLAVKEYADSSAGRYLIHEHGDYNSLTGYSVVFIDADIYPMKDGNLLRVDDFGMKDAWEEQMEAQEEAEQYE